MLDVRTLALIACKPPGLLWHFTPTPPSDHNAGVRSNAADGNNQLSDAARCRLAEGGRLIGGAPTKGSPTAITL